MDEYNSYNEEVHSNQLGEAADSDATFEQSILRTSLGNSSDLNVLVRDLSLSKSQDEILA
jgi:hypothetical protein